MSGLMIVLAIFVIIFSLLAIIVAIGNKHNGANWGHPATNVLDGWLRLYCKKFHRQGDIKIELPDVDHMILASNHVSAIDPFLLITATNRPIRFMIAKEEYERSLLNRIFKAAGCIPVDRGGRVEGAFRSALRAIKAGELVAIFPQGGIHCPSNPRNRIKPGIIKLSQLTGCSVLPVRIKGVFESNSSFKGIFTRSHVTFEVNQLLSCEQVQSKQFRPAMSDWLVGKTDQLIP
jgi:1-acyl-sn-glycerol-3-phosphate acyltransferase